MILLYNISYFLNHILVIKTSYIRFVSPCSKIWLKKAAVVDTSNVFKKTDLASLKSEFDRLDIDKLESTPVDLIKLTNAVKNEVVEKTVYDQLVKKVDAIQTRDNTNLVKELTMTQILMKLKRKLLIMTNILLLENLS